MDTVLSGVNAKPDLFPENPNDVPDINFFYRWRQTGDFYLSWLVLGLMRFSFRSTQATASCDQGRSSVITVRCDPEASDRGELSVPRYSRHGSDPVPSIHPFVHCRTATIDSLRFFLLKYFYLLAIKTRKFKHQHI